MKGISHKLPLVCALISPPAVTAVPLFVTYGDISPRRGENLSLPGKAFLRKIDFREDGLQALSKRHILCYDKREELLPGGSRTSIVLL